MEGSVDGDEILRSKLELLAIGQLDREAACTMDEMVRLRRDAWGWDGAYARPFTERLPLTMTTDNQEW